VSRTPTSALRTVALAPRGRSIFILSRTLSLRSWIFATFSPDASSSTNVLRRRNALPSTRNTRCPASSSIQ
jgi:hypothetical protein